MYTGTSKGIVELSSIRRESFPGGERHCFLERANLDMGLRARVRNSDDLMDLLLVANAIKHRDGKLPSNLYLPYMPGARQDRVTSSGHPFSLEVYASLINSMQFENVHIYEPHSDVTGALVKNCRIIPFDNEVTRLACELSGKGFDRLVYFAPDAGAEKRTFRALQAVNEDSYSLGQALKHRDPKTGRIARVEVVTPNLEGRNILVLDDICDGGRTFNMLAAELLPLKPKSLHLFVAHGIFSAEDGVDTLLKNYATVSTTDTVYDGRFGDKVRAFPVYN